MLEKIICVCYNSYVHKKEVWAEEKQTVIHTYNKTKEVDIGIQSNYFDVSENKKTIATIPFHSGLKQEEITVILSS